MRIRSLLLAGAMVAGCNLLATPAHATPIWNASGAIHPGAETVTAGGQCTANFVFYDSSNNVYIGQAAHCASTSGATTTNGCIAGSRALGTSVTVEGASRAGTLVYSSWLAMQAPGATPTSDECAYNDFALVKLHADDFDIVNPTIPFWGGPNAVTTTQTLSFTDVYTYGNSSLRFGVSQLKPKQGKHTTGTGWTHNIYTVTPGIPGDSGSAVLDENGDAMGILVTLSATGSNGVTDVYRALNYAKAHYNSTLQLATGLTAFSPLV